MVFWISGTEDGKSWVVKKKPYYFVLFFWSLLGGGVQRPYFFSCLVEVTVIPRNPQKPLG